ncbi:MAG: sugar phosphate isomerase/epimerase family protein [Pirellulales bacterium]
MKLGLINSAWVQTGKPTVYGLQKTKEIGFDTVDLFVDPLDLDPAERRLIAEECRRLELPIVSLCCVAVGLIDLNPSVRRFHLDRVRQYLDLAAEYRAKNVLLVVGEYIWNREVIPAAEQWQWAVEACRELGAYAAERKVEIVIELEPFALSLVNDVDTMVRFLDDVNSPAVRTISTSRTSYCRRSSPKNSAGSKACAGHVHISDCDGKKHGDLPPGRGVVPFEPYLQEIKALEIDGVVSIELEYSPEPERIAEWVEEAYQATDRLMQAVGLRG